MSEDFPRAPARVGHLPLHPIFAPIPLTCFGGALITDVVYSLTADILWADFSDWLITAGLIVSVFVVIAGAVDFLGERRIRALPAAWIHILGNVAALVLAIADEFIHTRDAYTSVVPTGLILTALVVVILLVSTWYGWQMVYRHGVGVRPELRQ